MAIRVAIIEDDRDMRQAFEQALTSETFVAALETARHRLIARVHVALRLERPLCVLSLREQLIRRVAQSGEGLQLRRRHVFLARELLQLLEEVLQFLQVFLFFHRLYISLCSRASMPVPIK